MVVVLYLDFTVFNTTINSFNAQDSERRRAETGNSAKYSCLDEIKCF